MNLLLDTYIWLWSLSTPERINPSTLDLMSDPENRLYLSAASSWEIAIKCSIGKLTLPEPPARFIPPRLGRDGIMALPIEHHHTQAVFDLPSHHNDPFDRLLIVQSKIEKLKLVTHDKMILAYDVEIIQA